MKTIWAPLLAFTLLAAPTVGLSQTGSLGTVTIALTLSYTAPGTLLKDPETGKVLSIADGGGPAYDNAWSIAKFNAAEEQLSQEDYTEFVSKIAIRKYGNKEMLTDLLDQGLLTTETIAGWSIIQVASEGITTFLAFHKTEGSVPLDIAGSGEGPFADARTAKTAFKMTAMNTENPKESFTESDVYSWKGADMVTFGEFFLSGISTGSGKLSSIAIKDPDTLETFHEPVHILGAQKFGSISGAGPAGDLDASTAVVEGSISIGPGKAVADVSVFQ